MIKKLDYILVIDIESTCWKDSPPQGQKAEIIEIGLCLLDIATRRRGESKSILVRPECSTVSDYCTALTTLTQKDVAPGIPFREACRILTQEYGSRRRIWASYGDYDRRQFERNCLIYDVAYPFGPSHINVKSLFAVMHALPREIGMAKALERLHLPLEGTHHRGGDDARNIALILGELLRQGDKKNDYAA
jgi:inhibitor of KinA sporulation pathway (predicted exonuclease)